MRFYIYIWSVASLSATAAIPVFPSCLVRCFMACFMPDYMLKAQVFHGAKGGGGRGIPGDDTENATWILIKRNS